MPEIGSYKFCSSPFQRSRIRTYYENPRFVLLVINISCEEVKVKYYSAEPWYLNKSDYENKLEAGTIEILIEIEKTESGIILHILKKMSPLIEQINFDIIGKSNDGKIEFNGKDNWNNEIYGYLIINHDKCRFFINCLKYSTNGIKVSKFYGHESELTINNDY